MALRSKVPAAPSSDDPWTSAMVCGDFERAWQICDLVLSERIRNKVQCWHWPRHEQFLWRGEPLLNKRVLVHCYHGLGDTLQFIRFLTPLRKVAGYVAVWAQPALLDIVATIEGVDSVHPLHDGAPHVDREVDIELMELPHALRIQTPTLPRSVPYIDVGHTPPVTSGARLRVGLVWRSGDWDERRSLDISTVKALLHETPGIEWYSFQYGWPHAFPAPMRDLNCKDIAEMGRRLRRMDLVITVDTMAAHLAGALGLRVWTLLPFDCDWRWMRERSDSIWYPTMKLWRQAKAGDWRQVVRQVMKALGEEGPRP